MSEFTGTIKNNPKTQKFTALNFNKDSDQSYRTQTQKGQKPSIQRKVFQPATKKLDETIEITDKEIHFTRKRIHFSAEKIRISDGQIISELEQANLTELLVETHKVFKRLDKTPKKHKPINY